MKILKRVAVWILIIGFVFIIFDILVFHYFLEIIIPFYIIIIVLYIFGFFNIDKNCKTKD